MAEACKTKAGRYYNGVVCLTSDKSSCVRANMDDDIADGINAGIDDCEIISNCGNKQASS